MFKIEAFKRILELAEKNHSFVSVYGDAENTSRSAIGYVGKVSNDCFLLYETSSYGFYDGYTVRQTDSILQINQDSEYIKKIEKLYNIHNKYHLEVDSTEENLFLALLQFAKKNDFVVSVELVNSGLDDVQGLIQSIDGNSIIITRINEFGHTDGSACINLADITYISCDRDEEQAIRLLMNNKLTCS